MLTVLRDHANNAKLVSPEPYRGIEVSRSLLHDVLDRAEELQAEVKRLRVIEKAAVEWLKLRDSLSGDCESLGIGSGDGAKWGAELARRCEPLRRVMSDHVYGPREPGLRGVREATEEEIAAFRAKALAKKEHHQ